jgi:Zn-dependent peptidase ImmA (M78 family)/DNA-binding XRE family transcriptional regulator
VDFNPARLDIARKRRGFTKTKLAEDTGISTRMITAYERGDHVPSPETVGRFSTVLGFPASFFFRVEVEPPLVAGVSFRALSAMTARQRDQALGSATLAIELADWIEDRFELPTPDLPALESAHPEAAAEQVRAAWGLGQRPAPNMVHLLEAHGVRVFSLALDNAEVDAFSFWRDGIPFVFLNTMKSAERSRMDAAHELGHLVLHRSSGPQGRAEEKGAQDFGSAFLMPRASVLAQAPRGARVNQIIEAKRKWKVAAVNLAFRMHVLDLLTDWQYRSLIIEMSKRGYRSQEPRTIPRENSQVLTKVFQALRERGQSKVDVARELAVAVDELDTWIFGLVLTRVQGGTGATTASRRPDLRLVPRD